MVKTHRMRDFIYRLGLTFALTILIASCTQQRTECGGPTLDTQKIIAVQQSSFGSGPRAFLAVPNPIDATRNAQVLADDPRVLQATNAFSLPDLLSPQRLETDFLKVRISSINDDLAKLAVPDGNGDFRFAPTDVHYSETMAYYSVTALMKYIEALGFSIIKTRPLYILVRDKGTSANEINALYEHNYLDPNSPRVIRLVGDTQFAPAMDRDMYWHEFGHLANESLSREVGMDFAGDNGAVYTEGAALHECIADYIDESPAGKPYIGRWIARNFADIRPGKPLRSAVDDSRDTLDFRQVSSNDGRGGSPERYKVAEWCSRVLWDVRSQFVQEDPETGSIFADRMILSSVSMLSKDASFTELRASLLRADEELHCGIHQRSIRRAFESRGFAEKVSSLPGPLSLRHQAVGLIVSQNKSTVGSPTPGMPLTFKIKLSNPNAEIARNVRLLLESKDPKFYPITYLQGFGDLPPGGTITIDGTERGLPFDFSVSGEIDKTAQRGQTIRFSIRVLVENGPGTVKEGEISL